LLLALWLKTVDVDVGAGFFERVPEKLVDVNLVDNSRAHGWHGQLSDAVLFYVTAESLHCSVDGADVAFRIVVHFLVGGALGDAEEHRGAVLAVHGDDVAELHVRVFRAEDFGSELELTLCVEREAVFHVEVNADCLGAAPFFGLEQVALHFFEGAFGVSVLHNAVFLQVGHSPQEIVVLWGVVGRCHQRFFSLNAAFFILRTFGRWRDWDRLRNLLRALLLRDFNINIRKELKSISKKVLNKTKIKSLPKKKCYYTPEKIITNTFLRSCLIGFGGALSNPKTGTTSIERLSIFRVMAGPDLVTLIFYGKTLLTYIM